MRHIQYRCRYGELQDQTYKYTEIHRKDVDKILFLFGALRSVFLATRGLIRPRPTA